MTLHLAIPMELVAAFLDEWHPTTARALVSESAERLRRLAGRLHEQLKALGLDNRLEIIPDANHAIKESIGKAFMKRMDRMQPGFVGRLRRGKTPPFIEPSRRSPIPGGSLPSFVLPMDTGIFM